MEVRIIGEVGDEWELQTHPALIFICLFSDHLFFLIIYNILLTSDDNSCHRRMELTLIPQDRYPFADMSTVELVLVVNGLRSTLPMPEYLAVLEPSRYFRIEAVYHKLKLSIGRLWRVEVINLLMVWQLVRGGGLDFLGRLLWQLLRGADSTFLGVCFGGCWRGNRLVGYGK